MLSVDKAKIIEIMVKAQLEAEKEKQEAERRWMQSELRKITKGKSIIFTQRG